MYEWIIQNKDLIKLFYASLIAIICIVITVRADKLFRLSLHQGIRYFRNAFIFYALAFIVRYLVEAIAGHGRITLYYPYINFCFEFLLIMAGFFLLYSLLWKKAEHSSEGYVSSLFNSRIFIFYSMSVIFAIVDVLWQTHLFLFLSQILIFMFAAFISYENYKKNDAKHKFPKFYFFAMLLSLFVWILNTTAELWFNWSQAILIGVYILNIIIFLLFLWGVIKVTKR